MVYVLGVVSQVYLKRIKKGELRMINKVNKKECLGAMEYFCQCVDLDDESDKIHYTKILMKKVANDYKIKLEGI
jgi:hypothetical protein